VAPEVVVMMIMEAKDIKAPFLQILKVMAQNLAMEVQAVDLEIMIMEVIAAPEEEIIAAPREEIMEVKEAALMAVVAVIE
jgi:hypothetical protein